MKTRFVTVLLLLLVSGIARAQLNEPQLIDEFGQLNSETAMARLQSAMSQLAEHLEKHPNSMLQFLNYRGQNQSIGRPYYTFATYKATYDAEHYDTNRIISTVCESRNEPSTQIWLIDSLAELKTCSADETLANSTTLFVTSFAPNDNLAMGGCCMIDDVGYAASLETVSAFADFIKAWPEITAYVVIYGGTNVYQVGYSRGPMKDVRKLDPPSFIRRLSNDVRQRLLASGLGRSRIILLNGGYRDSTASIDLWIVPPGNKRPKPTPNYFLKSSRRLNFRY